jgi:hypothetical protein
MYSDTSVVENQRIRSPLGDQILITTVRNLKGELEEENITISHPQENVKKENG